MGWTFPNILGLKTKSQKQKTKKMTERQNNNITERVSRRTNKGGKQKKEKEGGKKISKAERNGEEGSKAKRLVFSF